MCPFVRRSRSASLELRDEGEQFLTYITICLMCRSIGKSRVRKIRFAYGGLGAVLRLSGASSLPRRTRVSRAHAHASPSFSFSHSTAQHSAAQHSTAQLSTAQHSTAHSTLTHSIIRGAHGVISHRGRYP
eukprot:5990578-Pyramimonas_sp.AAC.1